MKALRTRKARMGDRSSVPPIGGMMPRKMFRYGSQTVLHCITIMVTHTNIHQENYVPHCISIQIQLMVSALAVFVITGPLYWRKRNCVKLLSRNHCSTDLIFNLLMGNGTS